LDDLLHHRFLIPIETLQPLFRYLYADHFSHTDPFRLGFDRRPFRTVCHYSTLDCQQQAPNQP
jgi:hypothetical protein